MSRVWPKVTRSVFAGLAASLLALGLWASGVLESWEARAWDMRVSWLAQPSAATAEIVLVLLDQASLDWASHNSGLSWPWPREVYAALLDFFQAAGAKAIALDVLFLEPSVYGVADDLRLAQALARSPNTVLAAFVRPAAEHTATPLWPDPDRPLAQSLADAASLTQATPQNARLHLPIAELLPAARLGNVQVRPDADGIYRRMRPFESLEAHWMPNLALATFLAASPDHAEQLLHRPIPLSVEGSALLNFRGPADTHIAYSAAAILQAELERRAGQTPSIDPAVLRDKYILFGFSAPGLLDLRPVPVGGIFPGVAIQATFLDNLLANDFMQLSPPGVNYLLVLLLSVVTAALVSHFSQPIPSILLALCALLSPVLLAWWFYTQGYWLPWLLLTLASGGAVFFALLGNYIHEGRQKRFIRRAFHQYLSPQVIEQLVRHPERLKLGGERRILSIFFADLQGFTTLSERMDPEALTELLNDYLSRMTDIIQGYGGTVDKYEGDAIIAFWNAPLAVTDHARRAIQAALDCQRALQQERPRYQQWTGLALHMRIGIHTGPAVVGNLGSRTRFDYTMLGDAVNLASRLEGVNKVFGTGILISQESFVAAGGEITAREIGRVQVIGRKQAVTILEPLNETTAEPLQTAFSAALKAFYAGAFSEALSQFSALAATDPVARAYVQHLQSVVAAPPAHWDGVWVMAGK
ncbi:CHASE2 domain-containing protein [Thiorhodospira sibirica]|uniref:CHASE2 domain-containing protein n=1 Tax=Thiorhodospira sibirica TaxID=154347 RepID=UPI00022C4C64|nr:adenylate/guanylate cyclase domain-containing protein [Thiorhodospira sibirica]